MSDIQRYNIDAADRRPFDKGLWCKYSEHEEERKADRKRIAKLEARHNEIMDALYEQGFDVIGWHLNGATEPLDNWFVDNDWLCDVDDRASKPEKQDNE